MDIMRRIKDLAEASGFDLVERRGDWNGFKVFNAGCKEECDVGLPQFILLSGKTMRWASPFESREIMAAFI